MPTRQNYRVFGILGPAYCGSTIWTRILGALPDVAATGEDRAIISHRDRKAYCSHCGGKPCPIYTPKVISDLRACKPTMHNSPWWDILAEATEATTLISSDKYPKHYDELGHPDHGLLAWKDPREMVASLHKRDRSPSLAYSCTIIHEFYSGIIQWAQQHNIPLTVLRLTHLRNAPQSAVKRFCSRAGLQYSASATSLSSPVHHIGGNSYAAHANCLCRAGDWQEYLTEEQGEKILRHPKIIIIQEALQEIDKIR